MYPFNLKQEWFGVIPSTSLSLSLLPLCFHLALSSSHAAATSPCPALAAPPAAVPCRDHALALPGQLQLVAAAISSIPPARGQP